MKSLVTKIFLSLCAIIGWMFFVAIMGVIPGERSAISVLLGFYSIVVLGYVIVHIFRGGAVPVSGDSEAPAKPRRYGRWVVAGVVVWAVYWVVNLDPAELEARREEEWAALVAARTAERNKVIDYEVVGTEENHHFIAMNAVHTGEDDSDDVLARRYFRTADYVCRNDRSERSKEMRICTVSIWNSKHHAPDSLSGLDVAVKLRVAFYHKNSNRDPEVERFTFRNQPYSIEEDWDNY